MPAVARLYGGRIRNEEARGFPYLLFMRFEDPGSLARWYESG